MPKKTSFQTRKEQLDKARQVIRGMVGDVRHSRRGGLTKKEYTDAMKVFDKIDKSSITTMKQAAELKARGRKVPMVKPRSLKKK